MKILFVVWDLSIENDANINIGKIVSNEMINSGHEVYMLGKCDYTSILQRRIPDNIHYRYIETNECKNDKKIIVDVKKRESILRRIFLRISIIPQYIAEKIKYNQTLNNYVQKIEELCKKEEIDVAISISTPFITSIALACAKINSKKVVYQLDPYFSHYITKRKRKKLKEEIVVLKSVDVLFTTKLIFDENKNNKLSPYVYKMQPTEFPNIRPIIKIKDLNDIKFNDNYINCVFVGNLYRDIRNADYLLQMFSRMKNYKIILHCIGGGDTEQLCDFKETLGERLIIYGVVNYEKSINAMLNADILINIGNTISNQMPSKIFDYISSGKPIINLVKMSNCPTLEYTQRYPLCLNIIENENLTNNTTKEIEDFCTDNKDKQINYSLVEKIYKDCTLEVVVKKIMDRINLSLK